MLLNGMENFNGKIELISFILESGWKFFYWCPILTNMLSIRNSNILHFMCSSFCPFVALDNTNQSATKSYKHIIFPTIFKAKCANKWVSNFIRNGSTKHTKAKRLDKRNFRWRRTRIKTIRNMPKRFSVSTTDWRFYANRLCQCMIVVRSWQQTKC